MATVYVGSARSDENGKAYNGKAGDQKSGKEVSTQAWYLHSKGWRVFRAKDKTVAAIIAKQMQAACDNNKIGYDQWQRNTLYTQAQKVGFNVAKVTVACETDCSALVRVCCAAAGIMDLPSSFRTGNMPQYLMATGKFVELKGAQYTNKPDFLGAGDILVTKTSGHTVVVLNNGDKYETNMFQQTEEKPAVVKNAVTVIGNSVNIRKGPGTSYGVFKVAHKGDTLERLIPDGWVCIKHAGNVRWVSKKYVNDNDVCTASSLNVRVGAGTDYRSAGTVHKGDVFAVVDYTGWIPVVIDGVTYWISAKYAK